MTTQNDVNRENARRTNGEFGNHDHTAPEATLPTDPKRDLVNSILAEYFDGQSRDEIGIDEVRDLMLDAINQQQKRSLVVVDGEGHAHGGNSDHEVLELDYLGEFYDDGNSAEFHVERATEDLEKIREAKMDRDRVGFELREYIVDKLYDEDGEPLMPWYDDDGAQLMGGRYGNTVIIEDFRDKAKITVRNLATGDIVSEHTTFGAAKAAALQSGASA